MEAWRWREALLVWMAFEIAWGAAAIPLAILAILVLGELVAGEPWWPRTRLDGPLMALSGVAVVSGLLSPWRFWALPAALTMVAVAAVVVRAAALATQARPEALDRLFVAWALGGITAGAAAVARLGPSLDARADLPWLGYNALATGLAVAVTLAVGLALEGRGLRRAAWTAGALVVTAALLLTFSRGGWLGAAAGVATLVGVRGAGRAWPVLAAMALAALLIVAATGPRWTWHLARLRGLAAAEGPSSRLAIWRAVPPMVARYPLLGSGLGTFPFVYAEQAGTPPDAPDNPPFAHNLLLNFAVETGLAGLLALFALLTAGVAAILARSQRAPSGSERHRSALHLAATAAFLGHQMVDGTVMLAHIAVGLFLLLGTAAGAGRHPPTHENPPG